MLVTDERGLYERAVSLGHYERFDESIQDPTLRPFIGLPLGGYKYRMHQMSSAVGRVQRLKHFRPKVIDHYAAAYRKAATGYSELLAGDRGDPPDVGGWHFFAHR